MTLEYDKDVQAVYIQLRDLPYAFGKDLDNFRRIDFSADGQPVGVELLDVDQGVNTDGLPERNSIEDALAEHGIKAYA